MAPWESALIGFTLMGTGVASIVWGIRRQRAWERGEDPPPKGGYSFHHPPSAPGGKRMALGIALIFVGSIMLAPFVSSISVHF